MIKKRLVIKFYKKALEFIKLNDIDINDFPDNKLIRTKDVLA